MTLHEAQKVAQTIMRILKVRNVKYPIATTEKGPLNIQFLKDKEEYEIVLDAVPLDMKEYDNRELKNILEKYWFTSRESYPVRIPPELVDRVLQDNEFFPIKKVGRPKGSKNKK